MPIKIKGATSGSTTITAPDTGGEETIELSTALAAKVAYPSGGSDGQALIKSGTSAVWGSSGLFRQIAFGSTTTGTSTTSTSFVDTGLSATITPASTGSKILIFVMQNVYVTSGASGAGLQIVRGTTPVWVPNNDQMSQAPIEWMLTQFYLDQPSTTSAVTYKTQFRSSVGGQTTYCQDGGTQSLMYLLEVTG